MTSQCSMSLWTWLGEVRTAYRESAAGGPAWIVSSGRFDGQRKERVVEAKCRDLLIADLGILDRKFAGLGGNSLWVGSVAEVEFIQ
jgi:hypothetical protein